MGRLLPLFPNILLGCKKLTAYYATWNNYGHRKVFTKERGLHYITLWIRNEREMDRLNCKLPLLLLSSNFTSLDKHTIFQQILYITN